jgi:hypothetical protein
MIRYTLRCAEGHSFDSWFATSGAYDKLAAAGMVACSFCGSTKVEKSLMAPSVRNAPRVDTPAKPTREAKLEAALQEMRKEVEANSSYVGTDFAKEARAMHDGTAPERAIHGEAKPEEARKLIEDGVPVVPLPFLPKRKVN